MNPCKNEVFGGKVQDFGSGISPNPDKTLQK
jgi:hypothetical protein